MNFWTFVQGYSLLMKLRERNSKMVETAELVTIFILNSERCWFGSFFHEVITYFYLLRPGANPSRHNNFWLLLSMCLYLASVIVVLLLFPCWYFSWDRPHMLFVFSLCPVFLVMVAIKSRRMLSLVDVSRSAQITLVFSVLSSQKLLEDCHKVHYLLSIQTIKH